MELTDPSPLPVLAYASTPPRHGPLFGLMKVGVTEADFEDALRSIAANEPPRAIQHHFRKFQHAVEFYASVRADQFALRSRLTTCCDCQATEGQTVAELSWAAGFGRVSALTLLSLLTVVIGHVYISRRTYWVGFSSYHGFCPTCWRRYQLLRVLKGFIQIIAVLLILSGVVFATVFAVMPLFQDHQTSHDNLLSYLVSAGWVAAAITGVIFQIVFRQLGVPASIKHIAPRPFQMQRTFVMRAVTLPGPPRQVVLVPKYRPANASAMSWQQTVGVLLTLFVGIPATVITFSRGMSRADRLLGYEILTALVFTLVLLTAWHLLRKRKIRSNYYQTMAEHLAAADSSR